jgi:uncharacterized repeat protein (TIGR03803 family)
MEKKQMRKALLTSCLLALFNLPLFAQSGEIRPVQAQTETVLYNFCSYTYGGYCADGSAPQSSLTPDGNGNFYGTTTGGGIVAGNVGAEPGGVVFELSPSEGGWTEAVLYDFCSVGGANCTDGENPGDSGVIFDSLGNLYGTTLNGGNGCGVVFELSPVGGSWAESVLYDFGGDECGPGFGPNSGVIMDPAGNLYGTTVGDSSETVFELSPSGDGWIEQVIYNTGVDSSAGLVMDASGNIFGTSAYTVFELTPNGNGAWNSNVIHTFTGPPKDGTDGQGTPVLDHAGNLYGTTVFGGARNAGTVYKLSPGTRGKWKEKILHSFKGGPKDGFAPLAGVVFDASGNIYGTTQQGGKYGNYGTVFELVAPVGAGTYKEKLLWSFNNTDGSNLYGSLVLDGAGNLYGTASQGGLGKAPAGVVFELTP